MQIPRDLPQFEKLPALFVTSGEYEARFYLAGSGMLTLIKSIRMLPRENAREKQAFIGAKNGRWGLGAVSHHGAYLEDLKKKFTKKFHEELSELIDKHALREVYLFAPKYVSNRLTIKLSKPERQDIRMQFYQEDTKTNPLDMIKQMWEVEQCALHKKMTPD